MKLIRLLSSLFPTFLIVSSLADQDTIKYPIPTLLATRGDLLVDDDGSRERGGKTTVTFENGIKIRAVMGSWERAPEKQNVWRSTWTAEMGHTPVTSYHGFKERNLIAEVTFRYGVMTEDWHTQCFRIAFDRRPDITGHIVSAWANPNNDSIETGFLLQHIRKTSEKTILEDLLLDRQPLSINPEEWYTAVLEVVDHEALFRMGDHIAYANAPQLASPKNTMSLTMGKTWHEIKRVRIWRARANPEWSEKKKAILSKRVPFEAGPHIYVKPRISSQ